MSNQNKSYLPAVEAFDETLLSPFVQAEPREESYRDSENLERSATEREPTLATYEEEGPFTQTFERDLTGTMDSQTLEDTVVCEGEPERAYAEGELPYSEALDMEEESQAQEEEGAFAQSEDKFSGVRDREESFVEREDQEGYGRQDLSTLTEREEALDEGFLFQPEEEEFPWEASESQESPAIPAGVAEFAVTLGKEWMKRRKGAPSAEKITEWLLQDYRDTLEGARLRFDRKYPGSDSVGRAWMISRQEQMKIQTSSSAGVKPLRNFQPPSVSVALVFDTSLIEDSNLAPVAPIVVRFVKELRQAYRGSFHVSTYRGHGGGRFKDRGYSIDLFLQGRDDRGFYRPEEALRFLRGMNDAARSADTEWRVIYNDFSVADAINQETGRAHVIFVGAVRKDAGKVSGLNWHGPHPLILHFHLDLVPRSGSSDLRVSAGSGITATPTSIPIRSAAKPQAAGTSGILGALPKYVADLVRNGLMSLPVALAVVSGQRDVNLLTNMIFYSRHPELPTGHKIQSHEKRLAQQWMQIRDQVVKPMLRVMSGTSLVAVSKGTASASPTVGVRASTPVGERPKGPFGSLTIAAPEDYRFEYTFTPDDAEWLARLIVGEAGGKDNRDNHAVIWASFNRFALFTHSESKWMKRAGLQGYATLAAHVQSYSTTLQPVLHSPKAATRAIQMAQKNPNKFKYIETGGVYPGTTIPKGQLKHHLETIQRLAWGNLREETKVVVDQALKGQLENPVGIASEFANTYTYFMQNRGGRPKNYEEWREYTEAFAQNHKPRWTWIGEKAKLNQMDENAFFIDNRVLGLPSDVVRVIPP